MPVYFFDIDAAGQITRDYEGQEFPDRHRMRIEAIRALSGITNDVPPDQDRRDVTIDVRDQDEAIIFTATLALTARWLADRPEQRSQETHSPARRERQRAKRHRAAASPADD